MRQMAVRAKVKAADQTHELVAFVQKRLANRADPRKAAAMAAYMKTSMPFYGVPKPAREEVSREAKQRFAVFNRRDYERAVLALWKLPHREEKYFAIDMARAWRDFIRPESLPLYRRLIAEGAWWDIVDEVAAHLIGNLLLNHREKIAPMMDQWIADNHLWIRRAAIISPL